MTFLLQLFINDINNAYRSTEFSNSSTLSAAFQCLFLRIWTPASKLALILVNGLGFFSFLLCHTWDRQEDIRNVMGSLRSSSTGSWSSTTWLGWALGRMVWMVLRMRLFAELNEHWRSACWMLSSASMVQRSHVGEDMSGMLSLKSLSLVGRMSWSICQRKVVWSEGRPGVTARVQVCSMG